MTDALKFGANTDLGLVRSNNEDCYLAEPHLGLWLVADGMGGHDAGEVASDIVKNSIYQSVKDGAELKSAIAQSHQDVKDAANMGIGSENMGTTVVALKSFNNDYEIAWVGDSRAYLWDPLNSSLTQLSQDHSYVQALYDAGSISFEEMQDHPQKNVITQSLGVSDLNQVQVDNCFGSWGKRQKILLCSDGLSDYVSLDTIKQTCQKHHSKTEQELADALIEQALAKGGQDNITAVVVSAPEQTKKTAFNTPFSRVAKLSVAAVFAALVIVLIGLSL